MRLDLLGELSLISGGLWSGGHV